jgi:hypothetical protein
MAVASALSMASAGMSIIGSIMGGSAQAQADAYQEQQAENAAVVGKTQAAQTSSNMTQSLTRQIQNIQAIRASAGVEGNSPTGEAIANNVLARGQQQIGVKVGSIMDQVTQDQNAAAFYQQSAGNALTGGILGGLGGAAKGLAGVPGIGSMNFGSIFSPAG